MPNEKNGALNKYARRILLAPKPAPVLESSFKGISYICNVCLLSLFWNIYSNVVESLKEIKNHSSQVFIYFSTRLKSKKYAKVMQAVVLLFWCVCLSEGQLGQTPLPWTNEMGK